MFYTKKPLIIFFVIVTDSSTEGDERSLKAYRCSQCPFTSELKTSFGNHLKIHMEKKFKCSECNYNTYSKHCLNKHLETHLEIYLKKKGIECDCCRKCEICNYKTSCETEMKAHVNAIHGNKPYKCEECSLGFKDSSLLRRHMANMHNSKTDRNEISKSKCAQGMFTTRSLDLYFLLYQFYSHL